MSAALLTDAVMRDANRCGQRTGQYLFNALPPQIGNVIAGSLVDPFHQELRRDEVVAWIDHHLIFDNNTIIAVFNGNDILWER